MNEIGQMPFSETPVSPSFLIQSSVEKHILFLDSYLNTHTHTVPVLRHAPQSEVSLPLFIK